METIVIHPGYQNSTGEHWQIYLKTRFAGSMWIEQDDWENVDCKQWVDKIKQTLDTIKSKIVFVGHSLGCIAFLHALAGLSQDTVDKVCGALLVSPCDTENLNDSRIMIYGFNPVPLSPVPFPTFLIASTNDPYLDLSRANEFANRLKVKRFIVLENAGHINPDSHYGEWLEVDGWIHELLQWQEHRG